MSNQGQNLAAAATDGTGVSAITVKKLIKDFVADFLLTAATAISLDTLNVLPADTQGWQLMVVAVTLAFVKAGYRALLRWATSP